jgi:hypothetical protein
VAGKWALGSGGGVMDEKCYFIKLTKDDRSWILYRGKEFSGYKTETDASHECINLSFASEFAAEFDVVEMSLDELKEAVGVPYNVYKIRAGLVKLEGVLICNNFQSETLDQQVERRR